MHLLLVTIIFSGKNVLSLAAHIILYSLFFFLFSDLIYQKLTLFEIINSTNSFIALNSCLHIYCLQTFCKQTK